MSRYKYVTPFWIDKFSRQYDLNNEAYADNYMITEVYILNDTLTEATVHVFFYNSAGEEHVGLRISDLKLPSRNKHFIRIADLIEPTDPNYLTKENSREGWLKVIGSGKLVVSGKITDGSRISTGPSNNDCWTIPFFENQIDDIDIVYEPIDLGKEPIDPIGWKIPRPFPK